MTSSLGRGVSRASQIPLYHQVANDLRERIASGAWPPGRQIPGEKELTEIYGVSRITIRQALANLTHEGLISRERGRGSFVSEPTITAGPRYLTSFTQEMRARGLAPSSQVLSIGVVPADERIAETLGIAAGAPVLRLERLRLGDGEPVGIQVAHIPAALFPGLESVDFSRTSLYEELERRSGMPIEEAEETYIAGRVEGEAARNLDVPSGTPVLVVERVAWSAGRPVEFTRSVMRGDRYRVQVRLRRAGTAAPIHRRRTRDGEHTTGPQPG